jgi:hypothetical protein
MIGGWSRFAAKPYWYHKPLKSTSSSSPSSSLSPMSTSVSREEDSDRNDITDPRVAHTTAIIACYMRSLTLCPRYYNSNHAGDEVWLPNQMNNNRIFFSVGVSPLWPLGAHSRQWPIEMGLRLGVREQDEVPIVATRQAHAVEAATRYSIPPLPHDEKKNDDNNDDGSGQPPTPSHEHHHGIDEFGDESLLSYTIVSGRLPWISATNLSLRTMTHEYPHRPFREYDNEGDDDLIYDYYGSQVLTPIPVHLTCYFTDAAVLSVCNWIIKWLGNILVHARHDADNNKVALHGSSSSLIPPSITEEQARTFDDLLTEFVNVYWQSLPAPAPPD